MFAIFPFDATPHYSVVGPKIPCDILDNWCSSLALLHTFQSQIMCSKDGRDESTAPKRVLLRTGCYKVKLIVSSLELLWAVH